LPLATSCATAPSALPRLPRHRPSGIASPCHTFGPVRTTLVFNRKSLSTGSFR
jgi:hypothetical protein